MPRALLLLLLLLLDGPGCGLGEGPAGVVARAARAAQDGDREAYAACFTPRSRALLRAYWTTAGSIRPALAELHGGPVRTGRPRAIAPGKDGRLRALVPVAERGDEVGLVLHEEAGAWRVDLVDTERERALTRLGGRL